MTKKCSESVAQSAITRYRDEHKLSLEAFGALFDPQVHKSTVLRWEANGVSAERAVHIEMITGIRRQDLRPDLFSFSVGHAA